MKADLFYAEGCEECVAARRDRRAAATKAVRDIDWWEINVLDDLDYAVRLSVMTLPSVAIEGQVVFACLPSGAQFQQEMMRRVNDVSGFRCVCSER